MKKSKMRYMQTNQIYDTVAAMLGPRHAKRIYDSYGLKHGTKYSIKLLGWFMLARPVLVFRVVNIIHHARCVMYYLAWETDQGHVACNYDKKPPDWSKWIINNTGQCYNPHIMEKLRAKSTQTQKSLASDRLARLSSEAFLPQG